MAPHRHASLTLALGLTAFAPDGKTILVGNMIEKDYWVFQWDGSTLKDTGRRVKVNGGPAAIRTTEK